ncbi:pyruvate dehydrogenase E1 component subunit beta-1, mitochondrial-like [Capsicum annuum]|uniref:pyruvate dehydrogenase E1 component subunit beta-1, mitochondrial-like n=1 Tax=Capsicum annuum TaxID=4072 RepID=UPI001FB11E22|nr:pyruvate dehydrogenase E1 component subunit beta-1, mitochondrial-like [Capsicum annuum]
MVANESVMDHLVNSSTKAHYISGGNISVLIVFRGPNGTALGVGAQHSQCHAQWYGSVPGLKVVALYSSDDAKGLLKATIKDPNPVVFLENKYGQYFPVSDEVLDPSFTLPIGNAKYSNLNNVPVYNQYRSSAATTSSIVIGGGSEGEKMMGTAAISVVTIASSGGGKDEQMCVEAIKDIEVEHEHLTSVVVVSSSVNVRSKQPKVSTSGRMKENTWGCVKFDTVSNKMK